LHVSKLGAAERLLATILKGVFLEGHVRLVTGMWNGGKEGVEMTGWPQPEAMRAASGENAAEWVRERLGFQPDEVQARLLDSTNKRVILNCTRQWGKSTVTAAKAVHHAYTEAESLTLAVSPSARQSGEFVRKVARFARKLGMKVKGDGDNGISVAFENGSRVVGLPGSESTIRGFSAVGLLLVDEAARVEEEMYLAVRPMLAVSEGTLWLMSTPHGSRGFFHEVDAGRGRVGAGAGNGGGVSADFEKISGAGETDDGGPAFPAGVYVRVRERGGICVRPGADRAGDPV
jgi:hypothetical protein